MKEEKYRLNIIVYSPPETLPMDNKIPVKM